MRVTVRESEPGLTRCAQPPLSSQAACFIALCSGAVEAYHGAFLTLSRPSRDLGHGTQAVRGNWSDAVAFGESRLSEDPVHAKWWHEFLGRAYSSAGQPDKATEAYKKARALPDPPEP